jgi:molybdopterin synthase sulfur carrier subunit
MIVPLRAFAKFEDILGRDLKVELQEGSTIRDLLDSLSTSHHRFGSAIFDESGQVREHVMLLKNRKKSLSGLETKLSEGDEVAILPPAAGG